MDKRALILGVGGQDGLLLATLLRTQAYRVFGTTSSGRQPPREIEDDVELVQVDLSSETSTAAALRRWRPHEIYNLTSISRSPGGWDGPLDTVTGGLRAFVLLEAIRKVDPTMRLFNASSSEIFGRPDTSPQDEATPVRPVSPYGAARAAGHFMVDSYRRRYGLFACSGILYNHESRLRSARFVSRKISLAAAAISLGLEKSLTLGNLDARRDWSYAGDVARAAWMMLLHDRSDDYVVASGQLLRVGQLVEWAFRRAGLDWRDHVVTSPQLARGVDELDGLVGNPSKLRNQLGWRPTLDARGMIEAMVDYDLRTLSANDGGEPQ